MFLLYDKGVSRANHIVSLTQPSPDGDGRITTTELAAVMRSLDQKSTDDYIGGIVKAMDADGDGSIDFMEFLSMMATVGADGGQLLMDEFGAFDKNGDGLISVMELKYVMSKLGERRIQLVYQDVDIDHEWDRGETYGWPG